MSTTDLERVRGVLAAVVMRLLSAPKEASTARAATVFGPEFEVGYLVETCRSEAMDVAGIIDQIDRWISTGDARATPGGGDHGATAA